MAASASRSRVSSGLVLLAALLSPAQVARAQGSEAALSALPERTFVPEASDRCTRARGVLVAPAGTHYPRERLAALEQYRWCLAAAQRAGAPPPGQEEGVPAATGREAASTRSDLQLLESAAPALQAGESFLGISFGVGVGVSVSADDVVPEAAVGPGNTVVAVKRARDLPRVILETHYYGWCASPLCKAGRFGWGPYLAIVAKSDKLISAFSAGLMVGWRNPAAPDSQGFSLGVGPILDDSVSSLAKGFEPGHPLPPGEAAIRYEEKARWGVLVFGSRTF